MGIIATAIGWIGGALSTVGVVTTGALASVGVAEGTAIAVGNAVVGVLTAGAVTASLTGVASLFAPTPQFNTSPITFKADINAGLPWVLGRCGVGGNIVFVDTSDDGHNTWLNYITVLSVGPVTAIDKFTANNVPVTFGGAPGYQASQLGYNWRGLYEPNTFYNIDDGVSYNGSIYICIQAGENYAPSNVQYWQPAGTYAGPAWLNAMWQVQQLGLQPEAALPAPPNTGNVPEWTSANQLSGLCCTRWVLKADTTSYPTGTPAPLWTVRGPAAYDPRQDSTYPGGSGTQRASDQTTWGFSQNPYILALAWLLGWKNNGIRTHGVGVPVSGIDLAAFVAGANVADANGWQCNGVAWTTDSKFDVLTAILQAGCGAPARNGSLISCMVNAPKVSVATLTGDDLSGAATVPGMVSRKDKYNRVLYTYRSEAEAWQMVQATQVEVASYITADGLVRTKGMAMNYVTDVNQGAQLARYAIEDSREFGPIQLPLKPQWLGLQAGDAITVNEPELGLNNQLCLVLSRKVDPATGCPTLTLRSETTAKHAYALGQTGSVPATPSLTGVDLVAAAPSAGLWSASGQNVAGTAGSTVPAIVVTGTVENGNASGVVVLIRTSAVGSTPAGAWSHYATVAASQAGSIVITGLAPGASYDVSLAYVVRDIAGTALILSDIAAGALNVPASQVTYANGASVQSLQPAQAGADVTGSNTAAAITGQGAFATVSQITTANAASLVGGQAIARANIAALAVDLSLSPGSAGSVGNRTANYLTYTSNGATVDSLQPAQAGADVTGSHIAAAIAGQGALATQSSVAYGSSYVTGFGALAASGATADFSTSAAGGVANRTAQYLTYTAGGTVDSLRPAQVNADQTSLNTAAAITGQGALATASAAAWGTQVSGRPANLAGLSGSESILNVNVQLGHNVLIDTEFQQGTAFWSVGNLNSGTNALQVHLNYSDGSGAFYTATQNVIYARNSGVTMASGTFFQLRPANNVGGTLGGLSPGQVLAASAQVATYRCTMAMGVDWLAEDGTYAGGGGAFATQGEMDAGAVNWAAPASISGLLTVPADGTLTKNVRGANLWFAVQGNGGTDPFLFVSHPTLAVLPPGQSAIPVYAPGRTNPLGDQTSANTAAAIAGQGALATLNAVTYGGSTVSGFGTLAAHNIADVALTSAGALSVGGTGVGSITALAAANAIYTGGATVDSLQPAQAGADVTSSHTAAAIAGQGALATASAAAWATQVSGRPANLAGLSGSESILNVNVQLGHNVLIDTEFQQGTAFWSVGNLSGGTNALQVNLNYSDGSGAFYTATQNVIYARNSGVTMAAGSFFQLRPANNVGGTLGGLSPGQVLAASAQVATYRCTMAMGVDWLAADGTYAGGGGVFATQGEMDAGAVNWAAPASISGLLTVPADGTLTKNVRGANLWFSVQGNGGTDPFLFVSHPTLAVLPPGQSAIPVYAPGRTNPLGDQTSANTAAAIAGQGALATQNSVNLSTQATGQITNSALVPVNLTSGMGYTFNPSMPLSATTGQIAVSAATVSYAGQTLSIPSGTITGLSTGGYYSVFYDQVGATYIAVNSGGTSYATNPSRYIAVGTVQVPSSGTYHGGGGTGGIQP